MEGSALDVLLGGSDFLSKSVTAIYSEVNEAHTFTNSSSSIQVIDLGFIPLARDNQFPNAFNLVAIHQREYDKQIEKIMEFFESSNPSKLKEHYLR